MPTGACRRALDPVVGMTSGTGCALQRVNSTPLGRRPAIHDFAAHIKESRGWSALADHDELGTVRTSTDAVIARRALIEPAVICITGRCADGIVPRISSIRIAAEALKLESTIVGPTPGAIVNGQMVREGSNIAGFRVLKIEARQMVVEREGVKLAVTMD